ncbi:MAG: nickel pincer cofactor biosynthesis protein LarB [Bacteroidales bacterium]
MDKTHIRSLLEAFRRGDLDGEELSELLASGGVEPLEDAAIDTDRKHRTGIPEVIFGEGKTPGQIAGIARKMRERGDAVLATRVSPEAYRELKVLEPSATYHEQARLWRIGTVEAGNFRGSVGVVSAGTSDLGIAEEAALTCEFLGCRVTRIYDVGVAGIHRLFGRLDELRAAAVLIVVAGMEGALPSVVAGLVDKPVIAVPTHMGYGANFQGVTALLAMLNSCAPGISVVNIDNGFGAACQARLIVGQIGT